MKNKLKVDVRRTIKKRIMFNKEDDYYFITYNVILFLYTCNYTYEEKRLVDYRKLAYIIPFIADEHLLDMLDNGQRGFSADVDVNRLQNIYFNARLNQKTYTSIILALESKGLVSLLKNPSKSCVDIWINSVNIPKSILANDLFSSEIINVKRFSKLVKKCRILNLNTMMEKIFRDNGVMIWETY